MPAPPRLLRPLLPLLLVLALFESRVASADEQSLQRAKEHFDEAQTLFLAGQYAEAAVEFQKAYDAKPFPAFLFNIAVCHEKKGELARALELYQSYLEKDPGSPDGPTVLKRIADLRQRVGTPASQPAAQPTPALPPTPRIKGVVMIESDPPGATIYLDSKRRGVFGRTPFQGRLPIGKHAVIVELQKFEPTRKVLNVSRSNGAFYLYFGLKPQAYLGWIEVKASVPGVDVFFDDKRGGASGRTPYTGFLRPGRRTVYLEKRGYQPVSRVVQIAAAKEHVVEVELSKVSFGWLRVGGESTGGATVLLDGKPLACRSMPCETELAPGQYRVEVQRKGWKSYRDRVTVRQAAETQLAVRLERKPPRTKAWVSFGVAGAFLTGGLICGLLSNSRADAGSSTNRPIDSGDSRYFSGKVLAITADSLFALGAVTAATGLYYLLRNEGPDSAGETREQQLTDEGAPSRRVARRPALSITPSLGAGSVGLTGTVEF